MAYQPLFSIPMRGVQWLHIQQIMPTLYDRTMHCIDEALSKTDGKFLPIWLNSEGGDYWAFVAIRDYILELKKDGVPIVTFCGNNWGAQSAALSLYALGDLRYTTPNTNWLLHSVSCLYDPDKDVKKRPNYYTDIQVEDESEEQILANIRKMTDSLFGMLAEDLGIEKQEVYDFLDRHGRGTNEVQFGNDLAKELNVYTHLEYPTLNKILKEIENINKT